MMHRVMSLSAVALTSACAHAGIVGAEFTQADFSNGYVFADGSIHTPSASRVAQSNPGVRIWRLWARVTSITDIVAFVGAASDDEIPFAVRVSGPSGERPIHHIRGGSNVDANNAKLFVLLPELAYDTWLTIGSAGGSSTTAGTSSVDDGWIDSWSRGLPFVSRDGGLFDSSPSSGEDIVAGGATGFRVLLGQFAIAPNTTLRVEGRLGGGGEVVDFRAQNTFFTAGIPAPGGLAMLGLAAIGGRRRRCAKLESAP